MGGNYADRKLTFPIRVSGNTVGGEGIAGDNSSKTIRDSK